MIVDILLLISLAKANDYVKRPWLFAAIYTAINLCVRFLMSSTSATFEPRFLLSPIFLLSAGFSLAVSGLLFTLLLRFEDSILMWLLTISAGILVLTGGAKVLFMALLS